MRCLDESVFMKLLLGELPPERASEVDAHLDTCASCRRLVADGMRAQNSASATPGTSEAPNTPELHSPALAAAGAVAMEKGTAVGRYLVLEKLGAGAMGVVYSAYDPELDRRVALKLLRAADLGLEAEAGRALLLREAQAMARVSHPHVVPVYDVGTFGARVFLAMELVEAQTLRAWLAEAPRTWRQVRAVFIDAGRGLAAAHAAGVVHGDFKPENVLVGRDGRVRVTDFGLARLGTPGRLTPPGAGMPSVSSPSGAPLHSIAGGTPAYMAPEQLCEGAPGGTRSDQFSFCVALYEALHGERPFQGSSLMALSAEVREGRVRPAPAGSQVPPWLRRLLLRGLSVKPEDRFPSMEALLTALQQDPAARWRRGAQVAGGVALLAAAVGVTHAVNTRRARTCEGAEDALASVWGLAKRKAVESAFLATGKPFATSAWQRVQRELDAYTAAWVTTRTTACEATRVRGEQSEEVLAWRMRCLDSRLAEVSALASVLSQADVAVVETSHRAVKGLQPLAACSEGLVPGGTVPPEDPAARERVAALRQALAQGRAMKATGRDAQGVAVVEPVAKAAKDTGDRREGAEALLLLGELREGAGDWKGAEAALYDAVDAAEATRQDAVAARAWAVLVRVSGVKLEAYELATHWWKRAAAAVDRLGDGNERARALLLTNAGALLYEQGHYAEAVAQQEAALALVERTSGPESLEAADVHQDLGLTLLDQGHVDEARTHLERAVALARQALGPEHPEVARKQLSLVRAHWMRHEYAQAETLAHGVLEALERALGPEHPSVGDALNELALTLQYLERPEEALRLHERTLAIVRKQGGAAGLGESTVLHNIGFVLFQQGRTEEALAHFEQVLALRERAFGPDSIKLLTVLRGQGQALRKLERYEQALVPYQRSRSILLAQHEDAHPLWMITHLELGRTYLDLKRPVEALEPLEKALASGERAKPTPPQRANARYLLARALWESGREKPRALALATEARPLAEALGPPGKKLVESVDALLASMRAR